MRDTICDTSDFEVKDMCTIYEICERCVKYMRNMTLCERYARFVKYTLKVCSYANKGM